MADDRERKDQPKQPDDKGKGRPVQPLDEPQPPPPPPPGETSGGGKEG